MQRVSLLRFSLLAIAATAVLMFPDAPVRASQARGTDELPARPRQLLETSIQNWNRVYGKEVRALRWTYQGRITSEEQKSRITNEMTNPERAWFPSGEVTAPDEMTALRIVDDPTIDQAEIAKWQAMVRDRVAIGNHIVRLEWTKGTVAFSTITITNESQLVYDSMLFNAVLVEKHSRCLDYRMGWLWQTEWKDMTRGFITADLEVGCDSEGNASCYHRCDSSMTLGEAKINCKRTQSADCCGLEWTYAWACGFKKVKVKADKFGLEVEGWIGSSGAGDGSCGECCPKPRRRPPPPSRPDEPTPPTKPRPPTPTSGTSTLKDEVAYQSAVFRTSAGDVTFNVPKQQSDRLSGSVVIEPVPGTSEDVLRGMVVEIETEDKKKTRVPLGAAVFTIAAAGSTVLGLALRADDSEIARQNVELHPAAPVRDISIPTVAQPGKTVTVRGPHSGLHNDGKLLLDGKPATFVAESGSMSVWRLPSDIDVGKKNVQFQEGTQERSDRLFVANVGLSAPKTKLLRGERTEVSVRVTGLEGYSSTDKPINLRLDIVTPGVVGFEGQTQPTMTRRIKPSDIRNGEYNTRVKIRAKSSGGFEIAAALQDQDSANAAERR